MRIAIQESALPGTTTLQRLQKAREIGFDGVEFVSEGVHGRVAEIIGAMEATGVQTAAVNIGLTRLLHPDFTEREKAIVEIRTAMTDSIDLGAGRVVFIPHYSTAPALPDLRPYKSAVELEGEMLVAQLHATLGDLAYALGAELHLLVVSQKRAHLINTLYRAGVIREKINNHPHITIGLDVCDHFSEEEDPIEALQAHTAHIGYVHLADDLHRLPGHGNIDIETVIATLKSAGYNGWLTLCSTVPNIEDPTYAGDLRTCISEIHAMLSGSNL